MTDAAQRYRAHDAALMAKRAVGQWAYEEEEYEMMDRLDDLWCELTDAERAVETAAIAEERAALAGTSR